MHSCLKRHAVMALAMIFCQIVIVENLAAQDSTRKDIVRKDTAKTKMKSYKEVVPSTAKTSNGFFSVHKVEDRYLLEIPDSLLGRDLLIVNRIVKAAAGPTPIKILGGGAFSYAGDEVGETVVRLEKLTDDKIFLRTVSFQERSSDSSANGLYWNVLNNNVQPIEAAFPIKAINAGAATSVIDVTDFVSSENAVLYFPPAIKTFMAITTVAADRSYIEKIQAFPMNIEIRTVRTYNGAASGLGAAGPPRTYEMNSSLLLLPKVPMHSRPGDRRIGFFMDSYVDYDVNPQGIKKETNIWKWRIEPKEEDMQKYKRGELVEPKNPIVIYIDPLTPKKWVPYLIAGIDDWQVTFQQAGFKNAILGKEAPVGDSTWSMEDARHSVLVYKPSDIENASGPSVKDPRSGEILETHINWYHNVMELLYKWYFVQAGAIDPRARKPRFDDSLMGNLIRFVSSHEIGHTLGLMHNFGASSTVPVENLRNKTWVEAHGHCPSIMDYARFNYVAQPEDSISEKGIFPRIGDYDKWAIQWGYTYLPDTTPQEEENAILNKWIVDKLASGPQYFYGSQLDPMDPMDARIRNEDPRDQNEDIGDDAMAAGGYGIKNLKRIEPHMLEWTREPHESYDKVGEMYQEVVTQYGRYMGHVLKNVGGVMTTPKTIDQPGTVFSFPTKEKQQRAMAFLTDQLFITPSWLNDTKLFNLAQVDFSSVARVQTMVLEGLLEPGRINRLLYQQEYEGAKAYTAEEMLHDLKQGVFTELTTGKPIEVYRRNLQKVYVERLCKLISPKGTTNRDNDCLSILKAHARVLETEIKGTASRTPAGLTHEHLIDLAERLDLALNPKSE